MAYKEPTNKDPVWLRIRDRLYDLHMTGKDLTDALGFKTSQNFTSWGNGNTKSYLKHIDRIARVLEVTTEYLLEGVTDEEPSIQKIPFTQVYERPIVGEASAGIGCIAEEHIEGYAPVEEKYNSNRYFWLKVKGDSMSPRIDEGDLVLVDSEAEIKSGSVMVVTVEDLEGYIKIVEIKPNQISLISINAYYPPLVFKDNDMNKVKYVGKVIESKHYFH